MRLLALCLIAAVPFSRAFADPPARRVASLAPSLTELIYDAGWGDRLVARSDACDFPPESAALPVAGSFGRPNVEWLLRRRPDVVVSTDLERPGLAATLRQAGIEFLRLPCESWPQLLEAAARIGAALDDPAGASNWIGRATSRRDALAARVEQHWAGRPRPRVYLEVWGDPLTTPGRDSFLTDLIQLAGGLNIGAALDRPYAHINAEWLLAENPDVIVLAYMIPQTGPTAEYLARRPGWNTLSALRAGRICTTIPSDWLLRPGPRWLLGAEALADFLIGTEAPR